MSAITVNGAIRQVVGASSFVDVVTTSSSAYEVRLYEASAQGDQLSGQAIYAVKSGAQPHSVWTVSRDSAGLTISGHQNGKQKHFRYTHDAASKRWTLGSGRTGVVQTSERSEQTVGADRIVRETVRDANGALGRDVVRTYRGHAWGEALVLEVEDPDGAALTTRYTYYVAASSRGQGLLQNVERPDGSWTSYEYDDKDRVTSESSPWLDSAITASSGARTVSYSYAPVDPRELQVIAPYTSVTGGPSEGQGEPGDDEDRPRMVIERVGGVEVSRTYYAYYRTNVGNRAEVVERAAAPGAAFGAAGNQRTTSIYEPQDDTRREPRRLLSVTYPDGRKDYYESVRGLWTSAGFVAGSGRRETVTHALADQPNGVSGKSTREVRYEDGQGNVVREETWANIDGAYVLASWSTQSYDRNKHLVRSQRSNGTETSASWGCCGYDTQTDEQGITTTYAYDDLGRVETETRQGITTRHIYDAGGREVETRRASSSGTLVTRRAYDSAGRLQSTTDESGLTTAHAYSSDGRTTTVTRPGGATEVTHTHADGRTESVTGTGVVAQYTQYAVASGVQIAESRVGSAASAQFERTVTDMLGRTLRTERPGFGGALETSEAFYDAQGRLLRQTAPGSAATLFAYDALGNQTRSALDLDGNGQLDLATDRVQETDARYVLRDGGVWQETSQRVYAAQGATTATTVSTQRTRLMGFAGGAIAESESVDIHGNATKSRTLLNAQGATLTQFVDVPDSAVDQTSISVQGRVIASISSTGLTTAFTYDGFGRRTGVVDGRTGTSTTHYDALGRVDYVEDAAQHRTSFAYEAATGRKIGEVNALGKVTRFAYSLRGELLRTWGDVPYPVEYGYDAQGRRTTMRTFREALAWNAETWPAAASGDTTTWEYDTASGLLSAKRDAAGQAVQYTYEAGGRLKTRRWARTVSGAPLLTTYNYQPASGELAQVDYSDATPDVSFVHDRLGRTAQVTDGTGSHVPSYHPTNLGMTGEARTGLVPATLTYKQATSGVIGRSAGVHLGSAYDVSYGYDASGRMATVGWNMNGQADSVTYARVPNSELLASVTYGTGTQTTYGYEATRDLKTQVKNSFGAGVISQYDYQYDALGRRTSVANSGSAFQNAAFNKWAYNDRNELIDSGRYLGTDVTQMTSPVPNEYRAYNFDPIGNRTTANEGSQQKSYQANLLNEYTTAAGASLSYDADGNLTSDGARKFTYDAENRLVLVEPVAAVSGAIRVRMAYNYLGRRVQKVVEEYDGSNWAAQDDVRFVYLGWNVIEERHTSTGVSTKKNFVWGLDLSQSIDGAGGIGGLLALVDEAGTQMAFLYNANGDVGQLVDEGGAVVARYEYDGFGQTLVASGAAANDNAYRFSTKYADEETGLVFYGYRFYSPGLGRWTRAIAPKA